MTKMKKKRKGFTLTELAIVIAVIAILIAVLVPTFVSLINKANESADEQAVKSMNTSLASAEAIDGKPDNAIEAMAVLEADGFNVENYVALDSGNTIYYDLTYNRCLIWTTASDGTGSVTYPSDLASTYASATGVAANWYTFASIYNMTADDIKSATTTSELTSIISSATTNSTVIVEVNKPMALENTSSNNYSMLSNATETFTSVSGGTISNGNCISGASVTLDLNGNTLSVTSDDGKMAYLATLLNGATLYIKDGTLELDGTSGATISTYVTAGCSITLENVEVTSTGTVIGPAGAAAQVNIINSSIYTTGAYCIATNSYSTANYNVAINIENSTLEANRSSKYDDSCVICMNVDGTLNISDSTITGQRQGVMVRAGTANITNTKITCSMNSTTISSGISNNQYSNIYGRTTYTKKWGAGNEVSMGAVVVGNNNYGKGYLADAVVTLTGCELTYTVDGSSSSEYAIALFVVANNAYNGVYYNTSVDVSGCTFNGKVIKLDASKTTSTESYNSGCTCNLTGYTGYYTTWDSTNSKWTTGS